MTGSRDLCSQSPESRDEAPNARLARPWLMPLVLVGSAVLVALELRRLAGDRASDFGVARVGPMPAECAFRYRRARSADDTAIVDAIVLANARQPSTALSCGIYRTHALEPGTGTAELRRP